MIPPDLYRYSSYYIVTVCACKCFFNFVIRLTADLFVLGAIDQLPIRDTVS
jgi:hypothetical protein